MRAPTENVYTLIEGLEDRRMEVYLDSGQPPVPTGGVGHTGKDLPPVGTKLTPEQVTAWFHADVAEACATIARFVPADVLAQIPDVSYDALVCFVFNVGRQAFVDPKTGAQTNFSKTLNACKWTEVDDRMRDWVYDGGRKVNGLINRRNVESAQWNLGFDMGIQEAAKPAMAAAAAAASTATALPAEVTGITPTAPPKDKVLSGKGIAGVLTTGIGLAAGNAPEIVSTGSQLRNMIGDIKFFNVLGAVLVAIGIGFILWEKIHARKNSGA